MYIILRFLVYLVLWDEKILGHLLHSNSTLSMKARRDLTTLKALDTTECFVDKSSKLDKPYNAKWFENAQKEMANIKNRRLQDSLVSTFYGFCNESSDIYDEDSIAFAKAYKDALVRWFSLS